ncbi:hypothetical protein L6V77_35520 [Myxococcota bacterium]|nr:hypothetical protein [Myxococcota bacterium]
MRQFDALHRLDRDEHVALDPTEAAPDLSGDRKERVAVTDAEARAAA